MAPSIGRRGPAARFRSPRALTRLTLLTLASACLDEPSTPSGPAVPLRSTAATTTGTLVGASNIASCSSSARDEWTAEVVKGVLAGDTAAIVFAAGDIAYDRGSATEFQNCYHPSWGQFKDRTRPAVGDREYKTTTAKGYFDYWNGIGADSGAAGSRQRGYYSYDVGAWHVVVLNTNDDYVGTGTGSPQEQWLVADLAASPKQCTLAIWHHARFASGSSSPLPAPSDRTQALWEALYSAGAELVVAGHQSFYERFAPQTTMGVADPQFGLRQITVGTGGRSVSTPTVLAPHSEAVNGTTFGVLRLALHEDGYRWDFLPVAGGTYTDSGSGECHGAPPANVEPTASFNHACYAQECRFTDWSRDPDGVVVSRTWDFGDGTTSSAQHPTHTYPAAGTYLVKLKVWDSRGLRRSTSEEIAVTSSPPPEPPPPPLGSCFDTRTPTVTLAGTYVSSWNLDLPAEAFIDARRALWQWAPTGGAVHLGVSGGICWHGGRVEGTADPESTAWDTYHDTHAYRVYGPDMILENLYASNVGDGLRIRAGGNRWTARRVHLADIHDDCLESDWLWGGHLEDFLFEGCYTGLGFRTSSATTTPYGGASKGDTVRVFDGVVWMKPIKNTYDMDPPNSTGAIFKVGADSPVFWLKNVVIRVDVRPGVESSTGACFQKADLKLLAENVTVVWTGEGDYPCNEPFPPGVVLTRDLALYEAAVVDWKARHPGL